MRKKNIGYMVKTIYHADKGLVWFSLIKNSMEQIFYVFFFVYLIKYIFECIEKNIPYRSLFIFLVVACSLHIVIHFMCGWYECYRQIRTPKLYQHIFHQVMDLSEHMELSEFENPDFYDKYARALDQCVDQGMNMIITLGVFIGNILAAAFTLVIVTSVDPVLLIFMIFPIVASFYFGAKGSKNQFQMEKELTRNKRMGEYVKRVFYEKKYAGELRLYGINDLMVNKQQEAVSGMYKTSMFYRMKNALYSFCAFGSYTIIATLGAYVYVAIVIKMGIHHDVAGYIAMINALAFSSGQFRDAVVHGIELLKQNEMIGNLRTFLETPKHKDGATTDCGEIESIEFEHVSFTYPGAKEPTLRNLSFSWNKGERVALVGYNGAGKTTLIKLLMGLYPVTEGRILVNGKDIMTLDRDVYHQHFGTVFQDLQVFAMTLGENVLMRTPKTKEDRERAEEALKLAQFGDTLSKLPKGLDTMITREFDDDGFVCSGGQAQKIAIARVFARRPDMVILDEPSSALDPLAEYNMYRNMMKASKNKGVLFISHRLSSARMANKVYLMKQGEIIEEGTHATLMEMNGEYSRMFTMQAQNYQESLPEDMEEGVLANG